MTVSSIQGIAWFHAGTSGILYHILHCVVSVWTTDTYGRTILTFLCILAALRFGGLGKWNTVQSFLDLAYQCTVHIMTALRSSLVRKGDAEHLRPVTPVSQHFFP